MTPADCLQVVDAIYWPSFIFGLLVGVFITLIALHLELKR